MRRLLFASYWVPPRTAIGAIRAGHLLKHLPEFGWDVTTLTARLKEEEETPVPGPYIQTGYRDLRAAAKRAFGLENGSAHSALNVEIPRYGSRRSIKQRMIFAISSALSYPDEHAGWLPFAANEIRRALAHERWDAILTSAPPMTVNLAAALAHGRIPWIADLRDLWAQSEYSERSLLHTLFDDPLERLALAPARALIASSQRSAAHLRRRYPHKLCFAVSTGFDPAEWEEIPFAAQEQCTILYAGNWYRGQRDPSLLFAAVQELLQDGSIRPDEIRIDLYAPADTWLYALIDRHRVGDVVHVHGFVERAAVLRAQRCANRLVILSADGAAADGVVAGKLFEYFGARRPILAFGGPEHSTVRELLQETGAGECCRNIQATKAALLVAVQEHRTGTQRIIARSAAAAYTGYACAARFAEILDAATMPNPAKAAKYGIVG